MLNNKPRGNDVLMARDVKRLGVLTEDYVKLPVDELRAMRRKLDRLKRNTLVMIDELAEEIDKALAGLD